MKPFKKFSLLQETESVTSYNTTMEREKIIQLLMKYRHLKGYDEDNHKCYGGIPKSNFEAIATELSEVKEVPWSTKAIDYASHFVQSRDLTDEEWLKLSKEEILQLYKNCYNQLMLFANSNSEVKEPAVTDERVNVKLNQIFECEGLLYSIAIPEKASTKTNLSHGRIICEFIKT